MGASTLSTTGHMTYTRYPLGGEGGQSAEEAWRATAFEPHFHWATKQVIYRHEIPPSDVKRRHSLPEKMAGKF